MASEVNVHVPNVNRPLASIIIVIPRHNVMRFSRLEPTFDVFAHILMLHCLSVPNCPMLNIGRKLVWVTVGLHEDVASAKHVLEHEALPVSFELPVHPLQSFVLLPHDVVAALPRSDSQVPPGARRW